MTPGKMPGKKTVSELYDIAKVTPETIAYAAVMVRLMYSELNVFF
jgi:hypothetical protein